MAIARDGLFPTVFARVDKQGTPIAGMIIAGVLATLLIYANYSGGALVTMYVKIGLLSTLATLIPYAFCSLAVFLDKGKRATISTATTIVAALAFIYAGVAIYGAGQEIVFLGFLLLIAGLPVYVWVLRQRAGA
jgi:amino acid transporter